MERGLRAPAPSSFSFSNHDGMPGEKCPEVLAWNDDSVYTMCSDRDWIPVHGWIFQVLSDTSPVVLHRGRLNQGMDLRRAPNRPVSAREYTPIRPE